MEGDVTQPFRENPGGGRAVERELVQQQLWRIPELGGWPCGGRLPLGTCADSYQTTHVFSPSMSEWRRHMKRDERSTIQVTAKTGEAILAGSDIKHRVLVVPSFTHDRTGATHVTRRDLPVVVFRYNFC